MATISNPIVSNTINSSYVLIENASFPPRLGNGGIHTLSAPLVNILYFHGSEGQRRANFFDSPAYGEKLQPLCRNNISCHSDAGISLMWLLFIAMQ